MKTIHKVKILLGCTFWIGGCITLCSLLISAAVMASTTTEWSGTSKFWHCLFENSYYSPGDASTLNAFPFWIFILIQFGLAIGLFLSAYYSYKKQRTDQPKKKT